MEPNRLPLMQEAVSGTESDATPSQNRTVLVAESNPVTRTTTADMLAAQGFSVVLAETGEEALDRIHWGGIDLLVCAMVMTSMDGFELLRLLRDVAPGLPVIAVVPGMSEIDEIYMRGAVALGAGKVFTQPLTPSVFFRSIGELLRVQVDLTPQAKSAAAR
jgi:CheY-like chemotaxis protein